MQMQKLDTNLSGQQAAGSTELTNGNTTTSLEKKVREGQDGKGSGRAAPERWSSQWWQMWLRSVAKHEGEEWYSENLRPVLADSCVQAFLFKPHVSVVNSKEAGLILKRWALKYDVLQRKREGERSKKVLLEYVASSNIYI